MNRTVTTRELFSAIANKVFLRSVYESLTGKLKEEAINKSPQKTVLAQQSLRILGSALSRAF